MAQQIHGVFFKSRKQFYTQIQRLFGIGELRAKKICKYFGMSTRLKVHYIDRDTIREIQEHIERYYIVGEELKLKRKAHLERIRQAWTFRAVRHRNFLPVRGQRTRTNAKTQRRRNASYIRKSKVRKKGIIKKKKVIDIKKLSKKQRRRRKKNV